MKFDALFSFCPVCGSGSFIFNNDKSKKCNDCGFVMYVNPSAAVAVFVINKNNELLVCVRAKDPAKGTLDLPGGFVDEHETAEEAARRELMEELGFDSEKGKYLFSLPNEYLYSGWLIPTLDMFFLIELQEDFIPAPADDVAECFFLPWDQVDPEKFGLRSIRKAVERMKELV